MEEDRCMRKGTNEKFQAIDILENEDSYTASSTSCIALALYFHKRLFYVRLSVPVTSAIKVKTMA